MHKVAWLVAAMAPLLVAACADPLHTTAEGRSSRLALSGDEVLLTDMTPSRGDLVGFGSSMVGHLAAGVPGGAMLGFSGQMAGGNHVGKAAASTVGALIGSLVGPVGAVLGSVMGGYAGDRSSTEQGAALARAKPTDDNTGGLDLGPRLEISTLRE